MCVLLGCRRCVPQHGPSVAMHETLVSVMRNDAHAWHGLLAEEWQPMAWWRVLHGVLLLLQLPRVASFEQDIEGELPSAPSEGDADGPEAWSDALAKLVSVRMGGGSTADVNSRAY